MASRHGANAVGHFGLHLPPGQAKIVRAHHAGRLKGDLLTHLLRHRRAAQRQGAAAKKKRRVEHKRRIKSSNLLRVRHSQPGGEMIVEGSIGVDSADGAVEFVNCSGRLVSARPKDDDASDMAGVLVLDVPGRGEIPCLFPTSLLDEAGQKAVNAMREKQESKRSARYSRKLQPVVPITVPVSRDDISGHLLVGGEGVKSDLLGRVVDDAMLAALQAGCVQIGEHSTHAVYTLSRAFVRNRRRLKDIARTLVPSQQGIRLFVASSRDIELMIRCGESAILSQLVHHSSIRKAVQALDRINDSNQPSSGERLLQLSVGGDVDSMSVGSFIPCGGRCNNPDIGIRCACGFAATAADKRRYPNIYSFTQPSCN